MIVFMNEGLNSMTEYVLGKLYPFGLSARLYTNNFTPDHTTKYHDFIEPSVSLYSPVALLGASWSGGVTNGTALYVYPEIAWNFGPNSGNIVVYGWWVAEPKLKQAVWSAPLVPPYSVPTSGGHYDLSVTFSTQFFSCS